MTSMRGVKSRRSYAKQDAEQERRDAFIAAERQKLDDQRQIDAANQVFRSTLTARQLGARVFDDFDPFCVAEHRRMFGWRHGAFR